ncbi:cytochrome P450 [Lentithecium fluviatile CBS 122367]|uniref:Cytochrome P450 n=1 Tax=Lentithecium fluviatile CBS 122367 TaxID=1168545 RepID=A0A6G1IPK3_9PLEO|nr:cytochrome P450 [Lentithecium fluviatile CBS 122367]
MATTIVFVVALVAVVYAVARIYLYLTQLPCEPLTADTIIPFLGSIFAFQRIKWNYYVNLRNKYHVPIYTLRLPGIRLYVVNSASLIQAAQKQFRVLSTPPLEAKAIIQVLGLSKEAQFILLENIDSKQGGWGFMFKFYKTVNPSLAAGNNGLDAINRVSVQRVQELLDDFSAQRSFGGIRTRRMRLLLGLNLAKDTIKKRNLIAEVFLAYFHSGGHIKASAFIQAHYEHSVNYKMPVEGLARIGVGAVIGALGNIVPTTFWLLSEIEKVTKESVDEEGNRIRTINVSAAREFCLTLLSAFQETLRLHSVGASARLVTENYLLDGNFMLKKGASVLLPQMVQHTEQSKSKRSAFRGFGGGTTLCPARHFATTETLAYTAMFIIHFDVEPRSGVWMQPTSDKSGMWTVAAGSDSDIEVFCRLRAGESERTQWHLSLSKSNHIMSLSAEDPM